MTYQCKVCNQAFEDKHASGVGGLAPAECPRCGEEGLVMACKSKPKSKTKK